jgi:hypothetical protein
MMDSNFKQIHACAYIVPRSVQDSYNKIRVLQDWWTLDSLKKTIPLNGLFNSKNLQFLIKTESNVIRVVADFREAQLIVTFPISKIAETDIIRLIEGFTFATALHLNMV